MPLSVGTPAPDFTLKTKTAEGLADVSLSSNKGQKNVVLLFFPGAFTGVCTKEMCHVTDGLEKYTSASAQVFGISGDSPFVLEEWSNKHNIGFPLLSDYQREVTKAYEVSWLNFAGLGLGTARAAFVIDKEGVIRYAEQTASLLDQPDYDAIDKALTSL